jgi:CheY-like chemotaxis protein
MTATLTSTSRVLLIEDDDDDFLLFLRHKDARQLPVEMQRARNAIEAFAMLRLQHEEGRDANMMIVLDFNMPAMHGLEFLRQLRADPALGSSIVVVHSGSAKPEDIRSAYAHHVAAYVRKTALSHAKIVDLIAAYLDTVTMPLA